MGLGFGDREAPLWMEAAPLVPAQLAARTRVRGVEATHLHCFLPAQLQKRRWCVGPALRTRCSLGARPHGQVGGIISAGTQSSPSGVSSPPSPSLGPLRLLLPPLLAVVVGGSAAAALSSAAQGAPGGGRWHAPQ
jgi:hypothetical protein